jgi:hypothetical protein
MGVHVGWAVEGLHRSPCVALRSPLLLELRQGAGYRAGRRLS